MIVTTYEFMFERCEDGIRFILWSDYYSDGSRDLIDIIEKYAPIRASKVAREIYTNIADRFSIGGARIIEADTKTVVFESYDDGDTLNRACLLDYFTNCIKSEIKEKKRE